MHLFFMGFPQKGIVTFGGSVASNKQTTTKKGLKDAYPKKLTVGSFLFVLTRPDLEPSQCHPPCFILFSLFLITVLFFCFQSTLAQIAIDWSGAEGYFVAQCVCSVTVARGPSEALLINYFPEFNHTACRN